jgi:hypothetical protein
MFYRASGFFFGINTIFALANLVLYRGWQSIKNESQKRTENRTTEIWAWFMLVSGLVCAELSGVTFGLQMINQQIDPLFLLSVRLLCIPYVTIY